MAPDTGTPPAPTDVSSSVGTVPGMDTTRPLDTAAPEPRLPSALSPSRVSEFESCPRRFWYRSMLRLPDAATEATLKGTLVHTAIEHLFELPRAERTPAAGQRLLTDAITVAWQDPGYAHLAAAGHDLRQRVAREAAALLGGYFAIEHPERFDPAHQELRIQTTLAGVPVVGVIDRLDRTESDEGERLWISDYKTGTPPTSRFEEKAFFQLWLYAAMVHAQFGQYPYRLRLLYLKDNPATAVRRRDVTPEAVERAVAKLVEVWDAIHAAAAAGRWEPKVSRLCDYCPFQQLCPAKGGDDERGRYAPVLLPVTTAE